MKLDSSIKEDLAEAILYLVADKNPYVMANRMGIDQPSMSRLLHRKLATFSVERLMFFLTRLSHDVRIVVRPAPLDGFRRRPTGTVEVEDESDSRRVSAMRQPRPNIRAAGGLLGGATSDGNHPTAASTRPGEPKPVRFPPQRNPNARIDITRAP